MRRAARRARRAKHPVGRRRRASIGLFGIVELVRNPQDDGADGAVQRHLARDAGARQVLPGGGLYTFVRWNTFFTNPPLCITEAELAEAFAIIDKGLTRVDAAIASTVTA